MEGLANLFQEGQRRLGCLAHLAGLAAEQAACLGQSARHLVGDRRHVLDAGLQHPVQFATLFDRDAGRFHQRFRLAFCVAFQGLALFGHLHRQGAQGLRIRRQSFADGQRIAGRLVGDPLQFRGFVLQAVADFADLSGGAIRRFAQGAGILGQDLAQLLGMARRPIGGLAQGLALLFQHFDHAARLGDGGVERIVQRLHAFCHGVLDGGQALGQQAFDLLRLFGGAFRCGGQLARLLAQRGADRFRPRGGEVARLGDFSGLFAQCDAHGPQLLGRLFGGRGQSFALPVAFGVHLVRLLGQRRDKSGELFHLAGDGAAHRVRMGRQPVRCFRQV